MLDDVVIVIDDERVFTHRKKAHYVQSSREGLLVLQKALEENMHIEELWLDHDLGSASGEIDDIGVVVDWLVENAYFSNPLDVTTIFVHTANSVAGPRMVSTLSRYYNVRRVPLSELNSYL